jgi:hypothetical protein
MDVMVSESFKNDIKFQKGRNNSFMNFMNECEQTPSYIAHFTDFDLKKGFKGATEDDIDSRLSAVVRLFCCLHGRDVFIS